MNEGDLTTLLREHASRHSVPGAAIGILRDGAATTAYYGVTDVSTGEPVTPETLFSLGSLTKSMVATVVARLADAGALSLDDPVAAHVPELNAVGWARDATVRSLLANSSGLPLRTALEFGFAARPDEDDGALARLVADIPGGVAAAATWSYSNVGWCVLGRAIEAATGAAWEHAMLRQFADTGLRETRFANAGTDRRAAGHVIAADGAMPVAPLRSRAYGPAGTTAVSTVSELLRFASLHLGDPALAVLRDTQAEVAIRGWLDAWCLGWARFDGVGGRVWGWDGLISGERSVLRIVPERQAAIVLMTNSSTGRAMYRSLFADLVKPMFGVDVPPWRLEPAPDAAGDLARFAGVYAWPDRRVEVTAGRDRLLIESDQGAQEAFPLDERTFLVDAGDPDNPTVTFGAYNEAGRPGVLYLMLWGLPRIDE